jgi:ADP-heptose:LPS heptosyltransferase
MSREPVDALGEVFIRLPFLRYLRSWAPEAKITIIPGLGGAAFYEELLAPLIAPFVDEVIRTKIPVTRKFEWVFDMEGDARTSFHLRRLATHRFYSAALRGFLNLPHLPIYHGKHLAKRYLGLLKQATGTSFPDLWPWPIPDKWRHAAAELLPAGQTYIALAPGAGNQVSGKCWPIDRYVALAQHQAQLGRVPVIILGGNEKTWRAHFEFIPRVRFPLDEHDSVKCGFLADPTLTTAIGARVSAAVANCNGTGHMLGLGGAPLVTLFGPSSAKKFAPIVRTGIHVTPDVPASKNILDIQLATVVSAVERAICSPLEGFTH